MTTDQFGITMFNATKTGAREWFSKWSNSTPRSMTHTLSYTFPVTQGSNQDPVDPEFLALADGTDDNSKITYIIDGKSGICTIFTHNKGGGGVTSFRPYIMDLPAGGGGINAYDIDSASPARQTWENVEMTCYFNVREKNADGNIRLAARSNHHNIQNCRCDAKGYDFQLEHGPATTGAARCLKEVIHDAYTQDSNNSAAPTYPTTNINFWTHSKMVSFTRFKATKTYAPLNHWVGLKFVLRTKTAAGHVRQQGYLDTSNGLNGGNWKPIIDFTDNGLDGSIFTDSMKTKIEGYWAATGGCGPEYALDTTKHVESPTPYHLNYNPIVLRPGYACYVRMDGLDRVDLKWFSIREIDPLP